MGNRPSHVKQKQKAALGVAVAAAAAAVDVPTAGAAATTAAVGQQELGRGAVSPRDCDSEKPKSPRPRQREPSEREGGSNNQVDAEDEEDPLQFFRRLSSLSTGESELERESQDLFMSYTQALLLKEAGDYAAASTLFRLVRNYRSLEVEAQYHLAQCLLLLDPELLCFSDEIVECLECVCGATRAELLDAGAWDKLQSESTELLAHVLVSQGDAQRAHALLLALRGGNQFEEQYAEQKSVLCFQTALCELVLGDLEAARTQLALVDCRDSLPLVHVDARAVEHALGVATRGQQRRRRTTSGCARRV